jgi:hypothetical protein
VSTIHGIGQAASSAFRTIGPTLGGYWYGVGLKKGFKGVVGTGWWGISVVTILAIHHDRYINNQDYEVKKFMKDLRRRLGVYLYFGKMSGAAASAKSAHFLSPCIS